MEPLKRASEELQKFISEERAPDADSPLDLLWMESSAEHDAFISDVVKPLWAKLASDLNEGRYVELQAVLQRVRDRKSETERYISRFRNGAEYAKMIIAFFQKMAAEHGQEERIGLIGGPGQDERAAVSWGVVGDTPLDRWDSSSALPENASLYFYLTPGKRRRYGLPEESDQYPQWETQYSFPESNTWKEVKESVWERCQRLKKTAESRRGFLDVLEFREHLMQRAFYQYEVYGYVSETFFLEQKKPLDTDVIEIIEYGLSLGEEPKPITFKSRSAFLDQIGEDKPEYGKRSRLIRKLKQYDLYTEGKRKGPGAPLTDLEKMLEVWRNALSRLVDRH